MNKGDTITIERVTNGFIVRPYMTDRVVCIADQMVFQRMGFATSENGGPAEEDLLGFIEQHFRKDDVKEKR